LERFGRFTLHNLLTDFQCALSAIQKDSIQIQHGAAQENVRFAFPQGRAHRYCGKIVNVKFDEENRQFHNNSCDMVS